jgi:hypothetical protein
MWAEGNREAGVDVPAIHFRMLSRRPGIRYDEKAFCRALREGIGASGGQLSVAMPLYSLPEAHCNAIWNYLEMLEEAPLTGVNADRVKVAIVSKTPDSVLAEKLSRISASVNERGGVWGRRIEFVASANVPLDAGILLLREGASLGTIPPQTLALRWRDDSPGSSALVISASLSVQVRAVLESLAASKQLVTLPSAWTALWREVAQEDGWRVMNSEEVGVCQGAASAVVVAERVDAIGQSTLSACKGGTVLFRKGNFPLRANPGWEYLRLRSDPILDDSTLGALADTIREALESAGRKALFRDVQRALATIWRSRSGEENHLLSEAYAERRDGSLLTFPTRSAQFRVRSTAGEK